LLRASDTMSAAGRCEVGEQDCCALDAPRTRKIVAHQWNGKMVANAMPRECNYHAFVIAGIP
jgi:hypothetical protein